MRQIKFRGRTFSGEWVYGSLLQSEIDVNEIAVECEIHERFADAFSIKKHKVNPNTVGQFTGLKDKNRVEIYEGDILATDGMANVTCYWYEQEARWQLMYHDTLNDCDLNDSVIYTSEVIGNVFEGAESLNSEPADKRGVTTKSNG